MAMIRALLVQRRLHVVHPFLVSFVLFAMTITAPFAAAQKVDTPDDAESGDSEAH